MRKERLGELCERYRLYRCSAREIVMRELSELGHWEVRLAEIGESALSHAKAWQGRRVGWDWGALYCKYRRMPRHIALAVWVDPNLYGLAVGKVSEGRVLARIDRLERNPAISRDDVISVAEVVVRFFEVIGNIAGCREVVLWNPADVLINYYKDLGYETEVRKRGKIVGLKRALP